MTKVLEESVWLQVETRLSAVTVEAGWRRGGRWPSTAALEVARRGWMPDIGAGRSFFYFKNCAFGFHLSLLFKANAPGFLLTGVMESFKYDYFSEKASQFRGND